jgi:hypothetical protein
MHSLTKLPKNKFKCFQCRAIFPQQQGEWIDWDSMQVHLCHGCNKLTKLKPERSEALGR